MEKKLVEKVMMIGNFKSKAETERNVNAVLDGIFQVLIEEKKIVLYKKFSLKIQKKQKKKGMNPKTKSPVIIPERNVIKFKASKNLLNKI
nr:HU family DNA-binding protein [uncultured Fusobacterium sp.]